MRVLFRADASMRIGSGHMARCLNLADTLQQLGGVSTFVCREHDGHLGDQVVSRGHQLSLMPQGQTGSQSSEMGPLRHSEWLGATIQQDASETLDRIGREKFDWLIVDHYALDYRWECILRDQIPRTLVIDDLADRRHVADVLLDQNLHADPEFRYRELVPDTCNVMIGPKYAILQSAFASLRESPKQDVSEAKALLIFMGGMDEHNLTCRVLHALHDASHQITVPSIHAVIGGSNPHRKTVQGVCQRLHDKGVCATLHVQVKNMAALMHQMDGAIAAGGTNTWERCCLGIPTATISVADNQLEVAKHLAALGVAKFIGMHREITDEMLGSHVTDFVSALMQNRSDLDSLSQRSRSLVDGQGGLRVVEKMKSLTLNPSVLETQHDHGRAA